ncbi:hypothetical protein B566_EDAN012715 [Ephemera danica]|nr:hypothetical protein B566_EDAN012715 [Ephemera danica]
MNVREQEARLAAESLLTGSSSSLHQSTNVPQLQQHRQEQIFNDNQYHGQYGPYFASSSHSINSPSIELVNGELLGGIRHNGEMSGVRRFFCLFLTFDLLFTFLMWLICIMLIGTDIVTALENQIVHYNVHTSMFDVVMASACRFTILLLFYALLYINHWIVIALSTSGTCAFLIYKVFVFQWATAPQPVFQVLIILTSFILAWGETWFLDFRVIPQETLARTLVLDQGGPRSLLPGRMPPTERSPLLGNYLSSLPDNYTESLGNFYSPLDSPRGSDSEDEGVRPGHRREHRIAAHPSPKDTRLQQEARDTLSTAWALVNNKVGWKQEKVTPEGDLVESRPASKQQRRIFRFTVSAEGGGGVVTSREFIVLRHWGIRDGAYVLAGASTTHPDVPNNKKLIRGHSGPNCYVMRSIPECPDECTLHWLLDTDLRGWVPQYMVESALSGAMLEFVNSLRNLATSRRPQVPL